MTTLNDLKRTNPFYSADYLRSLSKHEQEAFMWRTPKRDLEFLQKDWLFWARSSQLPPSLWGKNGCFIWNIRAGRGFGKSRVGAETLIYAVKYCGYTRPNLAGATSEEVRNVMIEGESGIINCAPDDFKPIFQPSKKQLIWPNGVISHIYYGTEPEHPRGAQSDFLWCDEVAKWQFPEETMDNLLMGLRLGQDPRCLITSTPRPLKFLIDLENRVDQEGRKCCVVTRGKTSDNFDNLSPAFRSIISKYEGTRQGRQELDGEFLSDNPDALWQRSVIDETRVYQIPHLSYVVVGVDPAVTSKDGSDDTGIIVAGKGIDGHGYILGDYTIHETPKKWAEAVITSYNKHEANLVVGETNNGGDLVEANIKAVNNNIPFTAVHASRGKATRAEPISALYEQKRIHHFGNFGELEDQMCDWIPGSDKSPDRVDALVWALTKLNISTSTAPLPANFTNGYSFKSSLSVGRYKTF